MYADNLKLYEKLIQTNTKIELKGASMPYTSFNGNMFSFLSKDGFLSIRLPNGEREAFLKKFSTTLSEQHGTILKEYVKVPENLLKDTNLLKKYFDLSYAYVQTLKPKNIKTKDAK